jgi:phenylpropionate dioxygenase-like ring-hydroxylating dioxygenase large terminal subunit
VNNSPLDSCWYAVATVDEVGADPLAVEILSVPYVIWRGPEGLIAARDRCPHREAKLSNGTMQDGCLRCPYHGWVFGDEGRCVEIPSSGPEAAIAPAAHLNTLSVEECYGLVWFCPGEPASPIPHLGVDDDPSFTRLNTGMQVWNCSVTRMIDNMLDVAHFPYTHVGTFGREQEAVVPAFTIVQLDDTFTGYEYSIVIDNVGDTKLMSGGGADVLGLDMSTGFALPFSVRSTMTYENGIEQTLFMTAAPISAERSYYTFVLWRNDDVSESGQAIVDFELDVTLEDKTMLENLSGELALNRGGLADVAADRASVAWRRQYQALLAGESV